MLPRKYEGEERRKKKRTPFSWPISLWNPKSMEFFNGLMINISEGGILLVLPMITPVSILQEVEINIPRTPELAKQKGQYARIKPGTILRIDGEMLQEDTEIVVAIEFL